MQDDDDRIDPAERELFREAMREVSPLASDRRAPERPRPAPRALQREADEAAALAALESGALDDANLAEELLHVRPGIQKRVVRRLRRGQYAVEAELDLHGMSRAQAGRALAEFMQDARRRRFGCVRIIHGKGRRSSNEGPVLKPAVAAWLSRRAEVLAFCSARPADGGSGAVYVLLGRGRGSGD
ncbi:MAG: Smr/MutS family protein [Halofilum sp. (in: g-proteobacteria)]|nr:Smr/MutS family protein [Halofilum sp. (in: g-proteobacteria)]